MKNFILVLALFLNVISANADPKKLVKCDLQFKAGRGTQMGVVVEIGEFDIGANALYKACLSVPGRTFPGDEPNYLQCLRALKQNGPRCFDLRASIRQDPEFVYCRLRFVVGVHHQTTSGSAPDLVMQVESFAEHNRVKALNALFESCISVPGNSQYDNVTNAEICQHEFIAKKMYCE